VCHRLAQRLEHSVDAGLLPDTQPGLEWWLKLNAEYAQVWPSITAKREPPPDADEWKGKLDKASLFSPSGGAGD
jgi:ferredoxin